jgi:hypothetical protein
MSILSAFLFLAETSFIHSMFSVLLSIISLYIGSNPKSAAEILKFYLGIH